jgi:hypothetical protein
MSEERRYDDEEEQDEVRHSKFCGCDSRVLLSVCMYQHNAGIAVD